LRAEVEKAEKEAKEEEKYEMIEWDRLRSTRDLSKECN
jgi:hypothetical protein